MKEPLLNDAAPANYSTIIEDEPSTEDEQKIVEVLDNLYLKTYNQYSKRVWRVGAVAVAASTMTAGLCVWQSPLSDYKDKLGVPFVSLLFGSLSVVAVQLYYGKKDSNLPFPKHLEMAKNLARQIKESQPPQIAQDNPGSQVTEPARSIQINGTVLSSR